MLSLLVNAQAILYELTCNGENVFSEKVTNQIDSYLKEFKLKMQQPKLWMVLVQSSVRVLITTMIQNITLCLHANQNIYVAEAINSFVSNCIYETKSEAIICIKCKKRSIV